MESNSREARRRKIAERGADRLALITGRIQNLPPPPSSPSSQSNDVGTVSSSPLISKDEGLQPHIFSDQSIIPPHGNDIVSSSIPSEPESVPESAPINDYNSGSREPLLRQSDTSIKGRDEVTSSTVQDSSTSSSSSQPQIRNLLSFTPRQISSAITATERIRNFCSITLAFLVVLSHVGFPLLGSGFIKNVIFGKPIYLLLLTNITVTVARLVLEQPRGSRGLEKDKKAGLEEGSGWADQVGMALEAGLVLQKVVDAVFMDFSIYAIIVVCGLSLPSW